MTNIRLLMSVGFVLLLAMCVSGLLLLREMQVRERISGRIKVIHGEAAGEPAAVASLAELGQAAVRFIAGVGQTIMRTGLVSRKTMSDLEKTLAASGIRGSQGLGLFIGCKLLLLVTLPMIAWVVTRNMELSNVLRTLIPAVAMVVGLMIPDWLVGKFRARYLSRLEDALPDALDMMVICAQAGLGLGPAIIRVAQELQASYRELAFEFGLTANELQISTDSRIALANMGVRTELDSLKRFGTTLIQTIQYGTPLTAALHTLSTELRHETLVRMETKAARLPVMLTMPTILFILPCVFLIAGGPAMIQVMKIFNH